MRQSLPSFCDLDAVLFAAERRSEALCSREDPLHSVARLTMNMFSSFPARRTERDRSRTLAHLLHSLAARSPALRVTERFSICARSRKSWNASNRDLIESGDPYQVAWKAIASGARTCAFRWLAFIIRIFRKLTCG